jgi:hypothetical protein
MSYGTDFANAARRHLGAAEMLDREFPEGRRDVAGYLYGIAAERALKEIMRRFGMPLDKESGFYLHFPDLKRAILHGARGRLNAQLGRYASDGGLMREWDVKMRYAHSSEVLSKPHLIDEWAKKARELMKDMEAL